MVRFILACMVVVALTILATSAQFMVQGIEGARQQIAARNAEMPAEQIAEAPQAPSQEEQAVAVAEPENMSPEFLNEIETAAGGFNDEFPAEGFTNVAPKGLEDDVIAATPLEAMAPMTDGSDDAN